MGYERQKDFGTPESRKSTEQVTLTIDGRAVTRAGRHQRDARGEPRAAARSPSCAPPTTCTRSAAAACAWSRSRARAGTPASCTTPVVQGMVVHTQTPRLERLRRGVMELYISDHPLDCLTCRANNDCELQDGAANVGLRDVRYGYEGDNHLALADRPFEPVLRLRSQQVHRLQPLRARVRRSPGHVRADHRRPRLRLR